MPFAFLIVGVVLVAAGVRDKSSDLWQLVRGDFEGDSNYLRWALSILVIGSLGYIEPLKPVSRAFLFLLIVVLFLSNGGFFDKFNQDFFSPSSPDTSFIGRLNLAVQNINQKIAGKPAE